MSTSHTTRQLSPLYALQLAAPNTEHEDGKQVAVVVVLLDQAVLAWQGVPATASPERHLMSYNMATSP